MDPRLGLLTTPIALTNTHSVGVVRDALVAATQRGAGETDWSLPVVGETWDGFLNDINGFHVKPEHVAAALASASDGAVDEGAVGGGTGMVCHGFKGGIGTASRVVEDGWIVGVLVQANHGRRARLRVNGVPVGERIGADRVPLPERGGDDGSGSIIVLVGNRRTAAAGPVRAARPPGGVRDRPHRRDGRALERRLRALLRDRQPRPRCRRGGACRCGC